MFVYYASPSFFLRKSQYSQRIFAKKAVLIDELVKMKTGLTLNMLCYSLHASTGVKHNFWQDYKRLHHMEHSCIKSIVVLCKSYFLISKNRFSYIRKYSQMIFFFKYQIIIFWYPEFDFLKSLYQKMIFNNLL